MNQRIGSRVNVELPIRWRRTGDPTPPTLALILDLSVRGAHIAGWNTLELAINDPVEITLDDGTTWQAKVKRLITPGEYGIQFTDLTLDDKQRIIDTIGHAKYHPSTWATTHRRSI